MRERYGQAQTPGGTEPGRTLAELMAIAQNKQETRAQKERQASDRAECKRLGLLTRLRNAKLLNP
ncbi:MAG: hypothetical protein HC851_10970 [Acaryochloris sp. RU_4_1]|nr:hypothetical protein [Leptolyngbyaceae cyanobacterium SU_3_3]NJM66129.1 hypothetical protein [Acaryochloris sp. RU_4_1]NJR54819.1 hypothetical protein [Acaryochloris sp. CRU_2_0]